MIKGWLLMKKKLITKKKVLSIVFALAVVITVVLNLTLFPKLLQMTPNSLDINIATCDEVDLNSTNEVLGDIISEKTALNTANKNIAEEDLPYSFNIDSASIVTKYVYDTSFPAKNPIWVVVYMNSHVNYDLPMPKELVEKISESAWRSGQVWKNDNGDVCAHYNKYVGYVIVEVDAVTGKYNGFNYIADENFVAYDNSVAAYLEDLYKVNFNLTND